MKKIRLKAMAKINLGLDVVGKREDGYHEVKMIMQTIRMYDQIELESTEEPGIRVSTNLNYLPTNEDNLVYKAAKLLMDVPYCILRGTALAEGIGEKLTHLPPAPACYVLIAKPGIHVSTKFVYTNLKVNELESHPDIDGQIRAIRSGDLKKVAELCGNVLETVTIPAYPVIEEIKNIMKAGGALNACMSGSGPTVFGLFEDREKAQAVYDTLYGGELAKQVYLTTFFNNRKSGR